MVLVEDDFIDEFLAELDVLKIKLTYLVLNEIKKLAIQKAESNEAHFLFFPIFCLSLRQLEILQRQVTTLADSQNNVDDRTSRTKTEHAVLQARYHMLEEQLREVNTGNMIIFDWKLLKSLSFALGGIASRGTIYRRTKTAS